MKKTVLGLLLAIALIPAASNAQIVVRVRPPAVVVEHPGPPPEAGYVWVSGYHRWDGDHYVWVDGHYDRPPHPGAHWERHRWVRVHDHWEMREGHWR